MLTLVLPVVRTDGHLTKLKSLPKYLGYIDNQIFLPMVLRCARFVRELRYLTLRARGIIVLVKSN